MLGNNLQEVKRVNPIGSVISDIMSSPSSRQRRDLTACMTRCALIALPRAQHVSG